MKRLPETMRCLELRDYELGAESLAVVEKPVTAPRAGEVLVRVAAAPVNPSDLMFLRGMYGVRKTLPIVPGFEGAGEVVATGGGLIGRWLMGRRVACAAQTEGDGTWAEYVRTSATLCIPLRREVTDEQGAALIVNPLTAWALLERAREARAQAIVQSAAASALGRMINQLARRRGLPLVNIVRRREQAELLRGEGAEHVLDSSDEDFPQRLKELCRRLKVSLGFDAVAGELAGQMLRSMRKGGRLVVYGALSLEACQIDPRALIFESKGVEGFWLSEWLGTRSLPARLRMTAQVQKLLSSDLRTEVRARLALEDAARGLRQYTSQMTGGKIFFVPSARPTS